MSLPVHPNGMGYGKSIGAVVGGALSTLVIGGLSMAGVHLPDVMSNAAQTLITLYCVYLIPHDIGTS